jgi:hypothetical protein
MSEAISKKLESLARETPEEVTAWLGRLVLLYGVPFNYLIPDEHMLPKESIRFFFLDPIWIQCLVQGACSVGNTGYGDTIIDRAMNTWVQPNQPAKNNQAGLANRAAAGVRDRLRNQQEGVDLPEENEDLDWPLTGFLLRSTVVDGWRGLEVMAYKNIKPEEKALWDTRNLTEEQKAKLEKDGVAPLKPLRIEQLSRDVMLGIFNGLIRQLIIRQPQEGLHFGLTLEKRSYSKRLRELGYENPTNAGDPLKDKTGNKDMIIDLSENNLMRDPKNKGVINISALAAEMKKQLSALEQLKDDKFTSAEFAVEMIEAPGEFTFIPKPNKQS